MKIQLISNKNMPKSQNAKILRKIFFLQKSLDWHYLSPQNIFKDSINKIGSKINFLWKKILIFMKKKQISKGNNSKYLIFSKRHISKFFLDSQK